MHGCPFLISGNPPQAALKSESETHEELRINGKMMSLHSQHFTFGLRVAIDMHVSRSTMI